MLRADFMDPDHIRLRRGDGAKVLQWRGLRFGGVVANETSAATEFTEWIREQIGVGSLFKEKGSDPSHTWPERTQTKTAAPKGGGSVHEHSVDQAACGIRSERTRPPMSTISATRPSPRMVAPDTPPMRR
ncbi:hypothetical protein KMM349_19110 [Stenotrophomonas maltophilia]|nr:hypothetical protein KMM349_19110 [Stenotrophomonas maltophilia]